MSQNIPWGSSVYYQSISSRLAKLLYYLANDDVGKSIVSYTANMRLQ